MFVLSPLPKIVTLNLVIRKKWCITTPKLRPFNGARPNNNCKLRIVTTIVPGCSEFGRKRPFCNITGKVGHSSSLGEGGGRVQSVLENPTDDCSKKSLFVFSLSSLIYSRWFSTRDCEWSFLLLYAMMTLFIVGQW